MIALEIKGLRGEATDMDDLIAEIRVAVDGGAWTLALAGELALPDICVALESPNGETTARQYKAWWRSNLSDEYPSVDAGEIYKMRCSMLHQRKSKKATYLRVIFVAALPHGGTFNRNIMNDALNLDLPTFC